MMRSYFRIKAQLLGWCRVNTYNILFYFFNAFLYYFTVQEQTVHLILKHTESKQTVNNTCHTNILVLALTLFLNIFRKKNRESNLE